MSSVLWPGRRRGAIAVWVAAVAPAIVSASDEVFVAPARSAATEGYTSAPA